MSSPHHSIGVHELQIAYATEQVRPQQTVELVLERIASRGEDSVWISRRSGMALIGPAFSEPLLLSVANRLAARTHLACP